MRVKVLALTSITLLAWAGSALAAAASAYPGQSTLTMAESWLSGGIGFYVGVVIIFSIGLMVFLAHEAQAFFGSFVKGLVAISLVVFCVAIMGLLAGAGASIVPPI